MRNLRNNTKNTHNRNANNNNNNSNHSNCEKLLGKTLVDVRWQQYGYGRCRLAAGGRRLAAVHAVLSYGAAVDLAQGKSVTILAW